MLRGGKGMTLCRNVLLMCFFVASFVLSGVPASSMAADRTHPDRHLLETACAGGETLRYSISWFGIKAGELVIHTEALDRKAERFRIQVTAKSAGLLAVFYPVEDLFETIVEGPERLPVRYAIDQKEGARRNRKLTLYDQARQQIIYTKNDEKPIVYTVNGPVHNEFSSFMILRAMPLVLGQSVIVSTFADKKRYEVPVKVLSSHVVPSILGKKPSLTVRPHLKFKGLYKKTGDPVIWLTDDEFRIPFRIKARIVIGSLTAKLVEYHRDAEHI